MDSLLTKQAQDCDHSILLTPLVTLLDSISVDSYRHNCPTLKSGSIGGHVRHCVEFYQCLLDGMMSRKVDYDARRRDLAIESEPTLSAKLLRQIIQRIHTMEETHTFCTQIQVRECGESWLTSSYGRECRFLASHTIHHLALIAMLLRAQGQQPPSDFGVAPSTLKFRAGQLANTCDLPSCAPSAG